MHGKIIESFRSKFRILKTTQIRMNSKIVETKNIDKQRVLGTMRKNKINGRLHQLREVIKKQ